MRDFRGFVLIELIVAITIMAVLATIGATIFTETKAKARDASRRSDIGSIAQAFESHFDPTTGVYQPLDDGWFSTGKPKPPEGGSSEYNIEMSSGDRGFRVCASLEGHSIDQCAGDPSTCFCKESQQGRFVASAPPPTSTPGPPPPPTPTPGPPPPPSGGTLPVFPGAIGFGSNTPAGRGGTVYKVTNLNDSGPGSLRDCVLQSGPRVCVFEVSGVINLLSVLNINKPYITIAGQTAPPPGITLKGREFKVSGHDVLVQHIRTRVGVCCPGLDAVAPEGGAYNVVIDHVSAAWATDENMSAHGNTTRDITFLSSIMAEGLKPHSKGGVAKFSNRVAYIQSLFVHNVSRNPKFGDSSYPPPSHAQFLAINNLIYNWGSEEIKIDADGTSYKQVNFVGNVFKSGPQSVLNNAMKFEVRNGNQIYAADNRRNADVQATPSDWNIIQVIDSTTHVPLTSPPFPIPFTPRPSSEVSEFVLRNAGARPAERGSANQDPVDGRVVNDVKNATGTLISNESEVGGLPTIAQNTRTLDLPPDPSGDSDGDGYTNLEEWLHGYSAQVEP